MSVAAESGGRRGPGPVDEGRPADRADLDRGTVADRRADPAAGDMTDAVDLGAASLPAPRRSRPGRWGRRRADEREAPEGPPSPTLTSAGPPPATAQPTPQDRRRPDRARIPAVTSMAGLVAACTAGLLAGASRAALVAGAGLGLVIGILAGLTCVLLLRGRPPVEADTGARITAGPDSSVVSPTVAGRPSSSAAAAPGAGPDEANLGRMLTSVGHRYQLLSDRQLAALAALERRSVGPADGPGGGDPAAAADGLAHANRLARRMRRLAKTLEVLADDPSSWEAAAPATMDEILEAAIADSGEQDRVDGRSLHPASVDGEAVPDVVHLLAELIDNALTASSASGSPVAVLGRRSAEGYVLSVMDEGSGMAAGQREAANALLHAAPALSRQSPGSLGLATVSRLAARHGIAVTLLEAPTDGVIAKVRLPAQLLGGAPAAGGAPSRVRTRQPIEPTGEPGGRPPAVSPAGARPAGPLAERAERGESGGASSATEGRADPGAGPVGPRAGGPNGGGPQSLVSAAEARADLARRVQRSRPVPREIVASRRDKRPTGAGRGTDRPAASSPQPGTDRPASSSPQPGTDQPAASSPAEAGGDPAPADPDRSPANGRDRWPASTEGSGLGGEGGGDRP